MGLYLCVFDKDQELDGVDVGGYADFNFFRGIVVDQVEGGNAGSKCPILILHSDCDGEWSTSECGGLEGELQAVANTFRKVPPIEYSSAWQKDVAKSVGLRPQCLYDSFIDVNGEPLLERLLTLCRLAQERGQPILFQ